MKPHMALEKVQDEWALNKINATNPSPHINDAWRYLQIKAWTQRILDSQMAPPPPVPFQLVLIKLVQ